MGIRFLTIHSEPKWEPTACRVFVPSLVTPIDHAFNDVGPNSSRYPSARLLVVPGPSRGEFSVRKLMDSLIETLAELLKIQPKGVQLYNYRKQRFSVCRK